MTCPAGKVAITFDAHSDSHPSLPMLSLTHCAMSMDEAIPEHTMSKLHERALVDLSSFDSSVSPDHIHVVRRMASAPASLSDDGLGDVLRRNMARSCAPGYEVNDAHQMQSFACYYHGPYIEDDGTKRSVRLRREGRLHSCDGTDAQRRATEEDVRRVGHYKMGGHERGVVLDKVYCDIMTTPTSN